MNDPRLQAEGLAQYGRHGDSMLMHVNPEELQGLQSLAQANGTSLTTNPYTGQPEAFNFRNMLKTAAPIAAGFAFGPAAGAAMGMGATAGGIAAGALTGGAIAAMSNENILGGALMGGLSGMGGSGLRGATTAVGAAGQAGAPISEAVAANQAANAAEIAKTTAGGIGAQTSVPNMYAPQALTKNVANPMFQTKAMYGAQNQLGNITTPTWAQGTQDLTYYGTGGGGTADALKTLGSKTGDVATQFGGGSKLMGYGKMAGLAGMPLLAGYEPPAYGVGEGQFEPPYDPYSQLDLSMDTGLRLVSNGGLISLANGGDVGLGEGDGDFVTGSFAAGDFAEGDNFDEFAEVTETGQFNDVNQFNDFANDPLLLQDPGNFNDPLLQEPGGFNPAVNQPLPPEQNNFNTAVNQPLPPEQNNFNNPPAAGRFIEGSGDGLSDSIPASIDGQQEARLSDGEFVIPADVVSGIGNGSSGAGSAQLFDMMRKIRKRRTGMTAQPEEIKPTDMTI